MRIVEAAKTIGPGDVAASAEDHVGSPALQDPPAGAWRGGCQDERAGECQGRPPREPADRKGVELEAGFRNETRFDAIRRPGERHDHAACHQRFRDRERRQDVTGRPAGCDQAPQLPLRCHDERC